MGDIAAALERIDPDLRAALELAADRIRRFHELQPVNSWTTDSLGGRLGQRITRFNELVFIRRTAPLPSSLLMAVIPAQVAGVSEVVVVTPPGRENGRVPDVILAAAAITGVEHIITLGECTGDWRAGLWDGVRVPSADGQDRRSR
ncbi:MAG: histidinol dehydrogenase [Chloroflexota bacterium]